MKIFLWLPLILGISACTGVPNKVSAPGTDREIIGGRPVTTADPLKNRVVFIRDVTPKNTWYCTGVPLSRRVILTAGHCVHDGSTYLEVGFGVNLDSATPRPVRVLKSEIYPEYILEGSVGHGDVALLFLGQDIPQEIQIAALPEQVSLEDSFNFTALGFGDSYGGVQKKGFPSSGLGPLRTVNLTAKNYNDGDNPETFDVDQTQGRGVCQGDSGGPALVYENNKMYVVGVVSGVTYFPAEVDKDRAQNGPGDICKFSSVYMKTSYFVPWIQERMKAAAH